MNKKMSFEFNRTEPAHDRNGGAFWPCREQSANRAAIMQNSSVEINGGCMQAAH